MPIALSVAAAFMTFADTQADDKPVIQLDAATKERCLFVLRQGLHAEDFWPSIHAAEGLTLGGYGTEVITFLKPRLTSSIDDQQRCGVARELVRAGDIAQSEIMLNILAGADTFGHVHAAESLYKVVQIGDGKALGKAFSQDENSKLKLMAAGAIGRCGDAEAMAFLRSSLDSKDLEVLKIAAWILGRIGSTSDIPLLKKQLPRCHDKLLEAYVNHSLAALGDADGLAALSNNLTSTDPAIRTYAATFAGDARAVAVSETLKKMLEDPHADAAYRAAQSLLVLSRIPGDNAE